MASGPYSTPGKAPTDERLTKGRRVRKRREYLWLQHHGRRCGRGRLVVICGRRRTGESRLGITASKRVGNAVVRNRVKRLVREIFRRHRAAINPPRDVLVIVRASAAEASYDELCSEIKQALRLREPRLREPRLQAPRL